MAQLHPSLAANEFWYGDFIIAPNRLPDFERDDVKLKTLFTKGIEIQTPCSSSPMDTVTGSRMAILMALFGGIGVLHYNYPTLDDQIGEAEKVKRFEAAFVMNPVVLGPHNTVGDVFGIAERYGFFSVPITVDGTLNTPMVGLVTHRDVRYRQDSRSLALAEIMTPRAKLITARREDTLDMNDVRAANRIIRTSNIDTLPIVDDCGRVVALVTDSDIKKDERYPLATKDDNKQLCVLIAVESRLAMAKERIGRANDIGVDGIVVDASIVFKDQLTIAQWCRENFPRIQIVLGNVDSAEMVRTIVTEASRYCDGLRVGIGPGASCKTQDVLGTGRAQGSAVWECCQEAKRLMAEGYDQMPLIADGGIANIGDNVKALALGAQCTMLGRLLAGLDESPGEPEFREEEDRMIKLFRGMGSKAVINERAGIRYGYGEATKQQVRIPEGEEFHVPYRGSGGTFLTQLRAGMQQSFQKLGFRDIAELQKYADIKPLPRRER